jgi:hypothetical protein
MSADNPPPYLKSPFLMGLWCSEYLSDDATESSRLENELRAVFHGILEWSFLAECAGSLNPQHRFFVDRQPPPNEYDVHGRLVVYNDCWKPLEIHTTPLTLLTSLKPGLDSLFVDAAIKFKEKHRYWPLTIRIVLPYETKEDYLNCGLFDANEANEFNRLYNSIVDLAATGEEVVIPVPLDNDWCEEQVPFGVNDNLLGTIRAERIPLRTPQDLELSLRLRAAGEYIAAFSDLLVASYDPLYENGISRPDNVFDYSVGSIVEAKRRGLAWELIALTNNFTWADNGPVLRVSFDSKKLRDENGNPIYRPEDKLEFLHPLDTKPKESPEQVDAAIIEAAWQANGDSVFRRILKLQDEFNQQPLNPDEESEIAKMFPMDGIPEESAVRPFVMGLQKAASIRRRAAAIAGELTKQREQVLRILARLIGTAAICLGFYEHWHSRKHHDDWDWILRLLFLIGTTGCVCAAVVLYSFYVRSRKEEKRFDYRSLGEALRIQIYWAISGLERSVASDYLQRHRDELDWIRYVVSGASFPFRRWRRGFHAMNRSDQLILLSGVRKKWVQGQEDYFEKNVKKLESQHHFWHELAWSFAFAGVLQPFFMLGQHLIEGFEIHGAEKCTWYTQIALGLIGLPAFYRWAKSLLDPKSHSHRKVEQDRDNDTWFEWLRKRVDVIQLGLFISGLVGFLYFSLPRLPGIGGYLPNEHDLWIILNGFVLLFGGLSLAWTERNFHTEEHRSFSSMRMLYHSANLRLKGILDQMEPLKNQQELRKTDWDRLLKEAQDIIYNLGCEHLSENADWLIYHRARPLEPFMAG